jgi:hypothetical protein
LEFQSYSKHKNHFDIDSKQTYSEEIQVIPIERFSDVMKIFCFAFGEKNMKWHLVGKKCLRFNLRGSKNQVFKTFILFAWIMIWFAWESTAYRSRLFALDQKGLD